jgi:hypothetical protein
MDRYFAALEHIGRMHPHATGNPSAALGTWTPLGPGNIGGRTRAILINPQNPTIMYAAGVSGGIWKSVDSGASWNPLTDLLMSNIAVSTMAMDPNNPSVIFAGTGEVFPFKQDDDDGQQGAGIYKTIDGGATWSVLGNTGTSSDFIYVSDLVVSPHNGQRVYAATSTGVWRSLDTGNTWTRIFDGTGYENGCLNLAMRTDQPGDYLFASCGKFAPAAVVRNTSADASAGWITVLNDPHMGRTSLAIAPSNQATIYAFSMCGASSLCGNYYEGLWAVNRSTDSGNTWSDRVDNKSATSLNTWLLSNPTEAAGCYDQASLLNQGWYDNVVRVDPVNPNSVWVGGVDLFRSDDGGATWGIASHWDNSPAKNYSHADHHALVFHPSYNGSSNQTLYDGNDGGIFRTSNALAAPATTNRAPCNDNSQVQWTTLNNSYAVTQFYHGLPLPDGATYVGGTQDNGTIKGTDAAGPNGWTEIQGGDGGWVAYDPGNPQVIYAEYPPDNQHGTPLLYKSLSGGAGAWTKVTSGISDKGFQFIPPFIMDPTNSQRLWIGGYKLWRTENTAASWVQVGGTLNPGQVSAIAQSITNPDRLLVGTDSGVIYRLDNARSANSSTPWVSSTSPRNGYVAWIAFDPTNANIAYATYSSFDAASGDGHVYKSTDGGATWSKLDGSGASAIPDLPVHTIAVDPTTPSRLYIGTDLGVFATVDGGNSWLKESTGFANVSTEALAINNANGNARLYAFTHGRGAWRVPLVAGGCSYTFSPSSDTFNATGGSGSFSVLTGAGCGWQAQPDVTWLHTTFTGTGGGTVSYTVDPNPSSLTRTGHIAVGGQQFTVTEGPSNCTYSVTQFSQPFAASGAIPTVNITAPAGCAWQASSPVGWVTVISISPNPGSGNGTASLAISGNATAAARSATLTVAGIAVPVSQSGLTSAGGNDETPGATVLSVPGSVTQSTASFTTNSSDPVHTCTGLADSATAWFRIVPAFTGTIQINTIGSSYDTVLSAYPAASPTQSSELACNDDINRFTLTSAITLSVTAGQSYLLEVASYGNVNAGGTLVLTISSNDFSSGATPVGTLPFSTTQDTTNATSSAGDPAHSCTGQADGKTVWFQYTATFSGNLMIDTEGSAYDTVLSVYRANSSTELACNDDTDADLQSALGVQVTSGQTYWIEVSAWGQNSGGAMVLNINANNQPAQAIPVNQTVYENSQFIGPALAVGPAPSGACTIGHPVQTVWYRYTATTTGSVLATTIFSNYDTVLAVYTGSTTPDKLVACNDDISVDIAQSLVTFDAVAGQSFLIQVDSYADLGNFGMLDLIVHPNGACVFSANPSSRNFPAAGGSDSFLVIPNYPDCEWTPVTNAGFVILTSGTSIGADYLTYSVARNNTPTARSGFIGVLGSPQIFSVTQDAGAAPDLTVSSLTGPNTAIPGGQINVGMTVLNQGSGTAGPFNVEFYFSSSPTITTAAIDSGWGCSFNSLAPGASKSCSGSIGVPSSLTAGVWYLGAIADPTGVVTESDETNNARASDSGPLTVGTVKPGPNAVAATPGGSSGTTQAFTLTYTHGSGYQNFTVLDVLIASALDGRHACYLAFVPASASGGSLYLVDDAGDAGGPYQGFVLPGNGSISNSQCTVNGSGSSATASGNTLSLTLNVTFTAAFAGNKVIYLSAQDKFAASSGWQALSTWGVPPLLTSGPEVSGVSPAHNGTSTATYTFTFTDTAGWQDLSVANILINSAIDGRHACYLAIVPASNSVFLVDDAGDAAGPYTGFTLPGAGTAANSQCTVGGQGASISGIGNNLTVTLPVTFNHAFTGNQIFFLAARSTTLNSNWQPTGSISVP